MTRTPVSAPIKGVRLLLVLVVAAATVLFVSAQPAQADRSHSPGAYSPYSHPYGKSYGDWGAAWWRWAGGLPADENPITEGDGRVRFGGADVQPVGPVWFLAGNFGGHVERKLTVPKGKALFFPLVNFVFWAPEDCVFLKLEHCRTRDLTQKLQEIQDQTVDLVLTVDGVEYGGLDRYTGLSKPFPLRIKDGDLFSSFGYPSGVRYPSVSGGHWMMLKPLAPGWHEIHWGGRSAAPEFNDPTPALPQDITYRIFVK